MTKLARESIANRTATAMKDAPPPHDLDYTTEAHEQEYPPEVKPYAPPFHPDRISDATKTMCEAIDKIYLNTADELDARVAEFKAKVAEIEECVRGFKLGMREAGDDLLGRIKTAMGHCEDLTAKMQQSPFSFYNKKEKKEPEPPPPAEITIIDAGTS
jgi:hypothetical protein